MHDRSKHLNRFAVVQCRALAQVCCLLFARRFFWFAYCCDTTSTDRQTDTHTTSVTLVDWCVIIVTLARTKTLGALQSSLFERNDDAKLIVSLLLARFIVRALEQQQ